MAELSPLEAGRSILYVLGDRIARPPKRKPGARGNGVGEWDWFYQLPDDLQAHIRRRHHMEAGGLEPDRAAAENGYTDVEDWAARWVEAIRLTRAHLNRKWNHEQDGREDDRASAGELVGPVEVAELLGTKANTVHAWASRQLLPAPWATVSGTRLYRRDDIEQWAAETGRARPAETF